MSDASTRKATSKRPPIGAFDGAEVWCVDLVRAGPALCESERAVPRLSDEDREYANGWSDAAIAAERLATRIALRVLIERAAGAQWRGQAFQRLPHGKPYLPEAPVAFSVSHITGLALIAIAASGTIGVDLERSRVVHMREPRRTRIEVAAQILNATQLLPDRGDERFLQAWVRLEALAKAEGCGIGRLLTRLGIAGRVHDAPAGAQLEGQRRAADVLEAAAVDMLADLAVGDGLFAAVAVGRSAEVPPVLWMPETVNELERLAS